MNDAFQVETAAMEPDRWAALLREFDDAVLYQTWAYGQVRWGGRNLGHLVLKRDGRVVAMAQARLMRLPLLPVGIAYVPWGPLWRRRGEAADPAVLRRMLKALQEEYCERRGLMLRIASHDRRDASPGTDAWCAEYEAAGLTRPKQTPRQTILLELSHSLDALRKGLNQKWRNQLNQAEKKGLEFVAGTDDGLYGCFEDLYRDMHARKGFEEHVDVGEFRRVQRDIPDALKMRIAIARLDGQAVAGGVWSAIGDTGIYLLGATNALGMKNQGAYLLQWRAIEWMKQSGCRWYDLGGIDAVANPGVYHFKSGIAGKLGREISESACFEACANPLSRLAIRSSERLKEEYRAWRRRVSAAKQTPDARAEDDSAKVPLPAAATSQS